MATVNRLPAPHRKITSFIIAAAFTLAGASGLASIAPAALAAPANSRARAGTAPSGDEKQAPIDVNTADLETLVKLPGVGPAIAQRIIDYRKEHGPFKKVEELLNVRGIGDRSLAKLRDLVTLSSKS